jgi:myo-inositol 2-dehydrogenase/D-chiro-inositol 1-dehydrogenase
MKKGEIRVGFIGKGGITDRHIDAIEQMPGVNFGVYWSPSREKRPDVRGRRVPDVDAVLAESDAVFVCVTPDQHGIEKRVADARKALFVEKPLGLNRALPKEIGGLIVAKEIPAAVGYQWRASPLSAEARQYVRDANVTHVTARYLDPALSYVPDWFLDREISGGPVVEQATHVLDEARYLNGDFDVLAASERFHIPEFYLQNRPGLASATIPTEVSADIVFASGIPGRFEASAAQVGERCVELEMECADGSSLIVARDVITRNGEVLFSLPDFTAVSTLEQDRAFFEAVRTGDPTLVYSSYPDALVTHEAVMDIVDMAKEATANAA